MTSAKEAFLHTKQEVQKAKTSDELWSVMKATSTKDKLEKMQSADPEALKQVLEFTLELMKDLPQQDDIIFAGEQEEGDTTTLSLKSKEKPEGSGKIVMKKEAGEWKLDSESWDFSQ